MRAIVVEGPVPRSLALQEIAEPPEPGPGEAVVRVRAVGVCGSDVHTYLGEHVGNGPYPRVLGHEMVGQVVAVGAGGDEHLVGCRVVAETAVKTCGVCRDCRYGNYNLCQRRQGLGAKAPGAMADYVLVNADRLHLVPQSLSDIEAAMTEPCCVAFHAVIRTAGITAGDEIVVLGPGPIGLLAAQAALLHHPARLTVVGLPEDSKRLELAQAMGVHVVRTREEQQRLARELKSSVDVVVDTAGVGPSLDLALKLVRPSGQIVKVGWDRGETASSLDRLVAKAVTLHGAFSHNWITWERVLRLIETGAMHPGELAVAFPMEEWQAAFTKMASREVVKSILTLAT